MLKLGKNNTVYVVLFFIFASCSNNEDYSKEQSIYDFSNNQISGSLPRSIGNLVNLEMLSIYDNQINGAIPESIGNLVNLVSFNAGINQLEFNIPSSIGNLINLERLWINYNNLSGHVPYSICNLNLLTWAPGGFNGEHSYLHDNNLCPPYPSCIEEDIGQQDVLGCMDLQIGDVNYDQEMNVLDIIFIIGIILNEQYDEIADINSDQIINILDVIQLVNIILN